jgi:hypothetical protein
MTARFEEMLSWKKKQLFLQLPLPFIETIAYFTLSRRDI